MKDDLSYIIEKYNEMLQEVIEMPQPDSKTFNQTIEWLNDNIPSIKSVQGQLGRVLDWWYKTSDGSIKIKPEYFRKMHNVVAILPKNSNLENKDVDKLLLGVKNISEGAYEHIMNFYNYMNDQIGMLFPEASVGQAKIELGIKMLVIAMGLLFISRDSKRGYRESTNGVPSGEYMSEGLLDGLVVNTFNKLFKSSVAGSAVAGGLKMVAFAMAIMGGAIIWHALKESKE